MAVYRMIHISFWQDAFVLDLTPEEKYFYIYLMTNSKTNQIGCYEIPKKVIEMETGYNRETVEKLISRFQDYGKIRYSSNEMLLKNWHRYSWSKSPKVVSCMKSEYDSIKDPEFRKYVEHLFIDYGYSIDTVPEDYGEKEKEKEEKKEKENKNKKKSEYEKKYSDGSFEMKCVSYLITSIKAEMPDAKLPETNHELDKWCDHIEKMLRLDKRHEKDIYDTLVYARSDSFWKANIRSTSKFREKYETLYSQMKTKGNKQPEQPKKPTNKQLDFPQRQYTADQYADLERKLLNKGV